MKYLIFALISFRVFSADRYELANVNRAKYLRAIDTTKICLNALDPLACKIEIDYIIDERLKTITRDKRIAAIDAAIMKADAETEATLRAK